MVRCQTIIWNYTYGFIVYTGADRITLIPSAVWSVVLIVDSS